MLDTLARVRREAARLYTDARIGRVTPADASKLGVVLGLVARILESADLEARIAAVEAAAKPTDEF
jgi:hypothetical protein